MLDPPSARHYNTKKADPQITRHGKAASFPI